MLQMQQGSGIRLLLTLLLTITTTSTAFGQRTRVSSREDGSRTSADFLDSIDRGSPLGRDDGDTPRALTEQDLQKVDVKAVINLLKDGVAESKRLYTSLQQDIRNNTPELRSAAGEVEKLGTLTGYLVEDLERGRSLPQMLTAIQEIDSDWRLLSHRLGQAPRISNASLDIVDRIDGISHQLSKTFRIDPQLDRSALVSELAHMESAIGNIAEELEYDSRESSVDHRDLIYDCNKVSQNAQRIANMVLDGSRNERILDEYQRFGSRWAVVEEDLLKINNVRIRRDLRDVMDIDNRIHELMLMEKSTDREQLHRIAEALIDDVNEYFTRTPLKLLLHIKNAGPVLKTADDFHASVRQFNDCIKQKKSDQELLECYRLVEVNGNLFVRAFQPLKSNTASVVLSEIDDGIRSLRAELHLSGSMTSVDTRELAKTASNLEGLADDLSYDVRRWLQRERPSYDREVQKAMDNLVLQSQDLRKLIQSRPTVEELRKETSDLYAAWSDLHKYLKLCTTHEREHMVYIARGITDNLYDLQAPLKL